MIILFVKGTHNIAGDPNTSKSPRGIRGFKLNDGSFGEWKVQGKVGGYTKFVTWIFAVIVR